MAATEHFDLGELSIAVTRKDIKNVHLAVHPPDGTVTLTAPTHTRLDAARAYAITRLPWIRKQRSQLLAQARETPRQYVTRESHHLWGNRYLLRVEEVNSKPSIRLSAKHIIMYVRPGTSKEKRARIMHEWHKQLLHAAVPELLREWCAKMDIRIPKYYVQRMKTKWGSCSPSKGSIRLNTELVKKPRHLLAYIIIHELAHFKEPNHSPAFVKILDETLPNWESHRSELNELPI